MRLKILLLGSNGQLGSYLSKNLKTNSKYIIIKSTNYKINLICIKKKIKILNKIKPNVIINCSAYTNVDEAEKNKKMALRMNFSLVSYLSKYCKINDIKLVHFSTDYVFYGKNKLYTETDKCNPINYYGLTKLLGEKAIQQSNCKHVIFRISWLISGHKKSFLKKVEGLIRKKKNIYMICNSYSSPTTVILLKNFFNINLKKICDKKINGIFHLRNESILSYYKFSKMLEDIIFKTKNNIVKKINYKKFKSLAKKPRYSKLSLSKTKKIFKFPKNDLRSEILNLI